MLPKFIHNRYELYFLNPLIKLLNQVSFISPNRLTWSALYCGMVGSILIYLKLTVLSVFFVLLSGILDTTDGALARLRKQDSFKGAVLDIIFDRLVEFLIIFSLFMQAPTERAIVTVLMLGSIYICITSFLVSGIFSAKMTDKSFYHSPGIIERTESFLFFIGMIVFPSMFNILGIIFCMLVGLTVLVRTSAMARALS